MSAPTHKPIIDYFESLNKNLKDFPEKSFFRMDLEEITGSFRSGINFPAMVVESPEGDTEGSSIHSSKVNRTFYFSIYQKCRAGNFEQQNEILDECERIGLKIIARMRYDARIPNHFLHNKFQSETVKWVKEGPIFTEALYGFQFTGIIAGDESLKLDAADWDDIDLTC